MNFTPQAPPEAGMDVQINWPDGPMHGHRAVVACVLAGGTPTIVLVSSQLPEGQTGPQPLPFEVSVATRYLAPYETSPA